MSSLDLAEELEARAAALRAEARLEDDLEAAKQEYANSPTEQTRAAKQTAAEALRAARAERRSEGVVVGGDAFVDEEV
ncbi:MULTISPECIES: hypothetical protein [unclassified Nonomuraea]|uniref:hypothetical protein n=1 Tax=unclassified Nonomuraea TaxID=2593643 RepID=UPI0033C5432F